MAFDWEEYLTLANSLKGNADEASKRSAISRAYYCVFNRARIFAIQRLGYIYREGEPSHQAMWSFFKGGLSGVGLNGKKIKDIRRKADYDDDFPDIDNDLISAFRYAGNVLSYLSSAEKSQNNS
jgi:hypothetical protein